MKNLTRRRFVQSALLCSAGAALAAEPSGPHAIFPVDPRARIAVATYPFRASIIAPGNRERDPKKPGMDLAQFARSIPSQFGVQGIEPLDSHFPSAELAEVRKLRAAFDAAGVHTVTSRSMRGLISAVTIRPYAMPVMLFIAVGSILPCCWRLPASAFGFPSAATIPTSPRLCRPLSRPLTMQ